MKIHKTYQFRGYTCQTGYSRIREVLRICQRLYNQALAERIAVYKLTKKSVTKFSQMKWLTNLRQKSQQLSDISLQVERGVIIRLDRAFQSFFRRIKKGNGDGFPRFKPWQRYTCIELAEVHSGMIKNNRIKIKGLPIIRLNPSQSLPDSTQLKSLRIVLTGRRLTVDLVYEEDIEHLPYNNNSVGIDMGITERMTLSTDDTIDRRIVDRTREKRLQRAISRCKKGSNTRRKRVEAFAREKRKSNVVNRNECHRITTDIVRRFGSIAIEKLQIQNMTRKGKNKRGINREILSQSWGIIRQQLAYKAEWAGRQLVEVNPAYTSLTCSKCGFVNGKPKVYKVFECSDCSFVCDRDLNAALNIEVRGNFAPST